MRTIFKLIIICGVILMSAGLLFSSVNIPSSKRSENVIKRISPELEKQFQSKKLKLGGNVFLRLFKQEDILEIWVLKDGKFDLFKEYNIEYYSGGLGTKKKQGDAKSPEGFYTVYPYSLNPSSSYHLSFNIGYPNAYEKHRGYTGGNIMIHGSNVSIGCYAMTDERIEEIYTILHKAFENGAKSVKVHIFPFKMTEDNMKKYSSHNSISFWKELVEGYEYFEKNKLPPEIKVIKGMYTIQ